MANRQHLAILNQGGAAWNLWRKEHPKVRPDLSGAALWRADLSGAHLSGAFIGWTTLGNVDLQQVKGLETVEHLGPSTIGIDTIYRSEGHIPEIFLCKAGVPETFIEYTRSLVVRPIDY